MEIISEFLTGARVEREPDRVLATVLFTDIVGSTEHAAETRRQALARRARAHDDMVRVEVARFRGRAVKSTGDGVLATFDGPARAIHATRAIVDRCSRSGIEIRAGLHTGECEVIGDDVGGLAVHIGARVMAEAGRRGGDGVLDRQGPGRGLRASSSRTAASTTSRACPAPGASSPSPDPAEPMPRLRDLR